MTNITAEERAKRFMENLECWIHVLPIETTDLAEQFNQAEVVVRENLAKAPKGGVEEFRAYVESGGVITGWTRIVMDYARRKALEEAAQAAEGNTIISAVDPLFAAGWNSANNADGNAIRKLMDNPND